VSEKYDLVIKYGHLFDGSGNPWFSADIGVKDGKISRIGVIKPSEAEKIVDARGLFVSPGFVDAHSHSDLSILVSPKEMSKIKQGITTVVNGVCGTSVAPIRKERLNDLKSIMQGPFYKNSIQAITWDWFSMEEYLEKVERRGVSVNVATYTGHSPVRISVIGTETRKATKDEIDEMRKLLEESMKEGSFGVSYGLNFFPGMYADEYELIEIAKGAARYGGYASFHQRYTQGMEVFDGCKEAIRICEKSGARLNISHIVPAYGAWGKSPELTGLFDGARAKGIDMVYDILPFEYGAVTVVGTLPGWARQEGIEKLIELLKDPVEREKIRQDPFTFQRPLIREGRWDLMKIMHMKSNPEYAFKTIADIAEMRGRDPVKEGWDVALDLIIEEGEDFQTRMYQWREEDVQYMFKHNMAMLETDNPGSEIDHPILGVLTDERSYGAFSKVLGRWIREQKIMTWEEAIRKMTSMPAQALGLRDRGFLKEGYWADITIFNHNTIIDTSTIEKPQSYSRGIEYLIVNGEIVLDKGEYTGATPGKTIRFQESMYYKTQNET